eukprot:CAMPEP_0117668362 /NCGR_PEP_ID=MMETSP0804-20121206/11505_1 /TAXON_ID=1074897 /ORGANISM="Tetraselmis astigmatica, Strain CCMP880" /LENGTH=390 /DNA_ID=CAMNT_0005476241 /DNA_START=633 /DNA_END=1805 /DNA_ORIENTATION=+
MAARTLPVLLLLLALYATPAVAHGDDDHSHDDDPLYLYSALDQGGSGNSVTGAITIETVTGPATSIKGIVTGLSPGLHGFHIHATANFSNGCVSTGGHWNPDNSAHGAPSNAPSDKHMGDLGNIEADESGVALVDITIDGDLMSILGNQSFVVHEGEDELGLGGAPGSLTTGDAGGRLKCGAILPFEPIYAEAMIANGPSTSSDIQGKVTMEQTTPYQLYITGSISGLASGATHGWHIHTGAASEPSSCEANVTGGHYNPLARLHSGPQSNILEKHVGDFGNIVADSSGAASLDTSASYTYLWGPYSVLGRAWVLHAGEDDLGLGGDEGSLATGNAGARLKCGTITEEEHSSVPPGSDHDDDSSTIALSSINAAAVLAAATCLLVVQLVL